MNERTRHPRSRSVTMIVQAAALGAVCFVLVSTADADSDRDCPGANPDCGTHNMMLIGNENAFLSHLPMFHSEHRFQVIVEAMFGSGTEILDPIYAADRKAHPDTRMYTVSPGDLFVLSRLFAAETPAVSRSSFTGTVFRDHLERGGKPIDGLEDIDVRVTRVIYARELLPEDERSAELRYILFGKGSELFLAHEITQAPDFDQIVAVKTDGHLFTEEELQRGVTVTIPDRSNTATQRLRANERLPANGHVTGAHQVRALQLEVGAEYYFEEGELLAEPTFDPTPLEEEAGF